MFVKATEGTDYQNPYFAQKYSQARELGMERSAYHFFRPGQNPAAQALYFLRFVKGVGLSPDDLVLSVDVEVSDGLSPVAILHNLSVFIDTLLKNGERSVIIYTDPGFWAQLGSPSAIYWRQFYLWTARWGHSVGALPLPWNSWTFWQYTDTPIDESLFYGTPADLEKIRRVVPKIAPAKPVPWWTHLGIALTKGGYGAKSVHQVIAAVATARQHTP